MFARSGILIALCLCSAKFCKVNLLKVDRTSLWLLLARTVFGAIAMLSLFQALHYIALGKASLLFCLNPIIVVVLAGVCLSEKVTLVDAVAVVGAFAGVYFMTDVSGSSE